MRQWLAQLKRAPTLMDENERYVAPSLLIACMILFIRTSRLIDLDRNLRFDYFGVELSNSD